MMLHRIDPVLFSTNPEDIIDYLKPHGLLCMQLSMQKLLALSQWSIHGMEETANMWRSIHSAMSHVSGDLSLQKISMQ